MSFDQTPAKELQFSMEDGSPAKSDPSTQSMSSQEQCDSFVVADDASVEYEDDKKSKKEIDLSACAAKDEALWTDAHTSDEEEYDANKENEKGSDDESEVELACDHHEKCVEVARNLWDSLLQEFQVVGSKREAQAALVEVVCDHFKFV